MQSPYKPDFEDAACRWRAFWQGEIIDRPCTRVLAPRDGVALAQHPPGLHHPDRDLAGIVRGYDRWAASVYFGGEGIPFLNPNFGPDLYAAFLGADLEFAFENGTSWAVACVDDWKATAPRLAAPAGKWWQAALHYMELARSTAEGRFGIGVLDLHSNLDCLSAMRGPQRFCMDLVDGPDDVDAAVANVRKSYQPIYSGMYEAAGMAEIGTSCWLPYYCEDRFGIIQCDFICLISPGHARRFLYPALEEEAQFLDHCCYHLDGPDALVHLDDILAIEAIDSVQWVPGAGNPPVIEWMDLLKKIQDSGKSLYIAGSPDEVKVFHKELRPDKVFYDTWASSQSEADALLDWLKANT